jgi:transposase
LLNARWPKPVIRLPPSILPSARVRQADRAAFAETDRIDAQLLARFGAQLSPEARAVPASEAAELQELALARQAVKADETAIKNRYGAAESTVLKQLLKRQLAACQRTAADLEAAIAAQIGSDPTLKSRYDILLSIKGVGPTVAANLIACLPELGLLPAAKAAALAGVAPFADDSGNSKGARRPSPAPSSAKTGHGPKNMLDIKHRCFPQWERESRRNR